MSPTNFNPVVGIMVKQADHSILIPQDVAPIIQSDYSGRYDLVNVITIDHLVDILQNRLVLVIVLDHVPPEQDGLVIAEVVKTRSPRTRVVLLTDIAIDLGDSKQNVDVHISGMLQLGKIEQAIRDTLNLHVQETLRISLGDSAERMDKLTSVIKGSVGLLPIGSLIAEVIGVVIPNQRMARFERFLHLLAAKIVAIEEERLHHRVRHPQFIELLENASFQSVRATTEQRLEYIASLLKNSLTEEEVEFVSYKTLLALLGEISDIEVILLQYHGMNTSPSKQREFFQIHLDVVRTPVVVMGSPQPVADKGTIYKTYREHLVRLGLLKITFKKPKKGELPDFDENTGMIEAKGHAITPLGRLMLRYMDQSEPL